MEVCFQPLVFEKTRIRLGAAGATGAGAAATVSDAEAVTLCVVALGVLAQAYKATPTAVAPNTRNIDADDIGNQVIRINY